jgi:hypothetical protein
VVVCGEVWVCGVVWCGVVLVCGVWCVWCVVCLFNLPSTWWPCVADVMLWCIGVVCGVLVGCVVCGVLVGCGVCGWGAVGEG